jgi:rod shape-determining protein MreD
MRILGLFVFSALVALLLRTTLLAGLAAHGVVLDVLVLATVAWSLRNGDAWGATFGFLLGLAADLDTAHWLGRHALALTLLGYGVGRLEHARQGQPVHAARAVRRDHSAASAGGPPRSMSVAAR